MKSPVLFYNASAFSSRKFSGSKHNISFSELLPVFLFPNQYIMIIGIDIGGTTTDIVGYKSGKIIHPITVKADDPVASAAGALGKFLEMNHSTLGQIELIATTGVGSVGLLKNLFGIPVVKIDEFTAIGTAGKFLTGLSKAIVVSMGTGTAVVTVNNQSIKHWGGSGVGGGTLMGLSRKMLNISTIETLTEKASLGDLNNVDLSVGDIAGRDLDNLPANVTASNFGKMSDKASDDDVALAILNLVGQTIGLLGIWAARANHFNDIVLIGKLVGIPQMKEIAQRVADLHKTTIHIPENADFATAIGAAIKVDEKRK